MALQDAVQTQRHTGQRITWKLPDGTAKDLTGATITGRLVNSSNQVAQAMDGTLAVVSPGTNGQFDWAYGVNDVASAGVFLAQFTATYGDGKPDVSFDGLWLVHPKR